VDDWNIGELLTLPFDGDDLLAGRVDLELDRVAWIETLQQVVGDHRIAHCHRAHQALESMCLDKYTMHYKDFVAVKYAELVYNGMWFMQLREALDAFVKVTQQTVTGTVRLKLYKGNIIIAGRQSPFSLYREDYASFGEEDVYNQQDAHGFIQLFGLPLKVESLLAIDGGGESRSRIRSAGKRADLRAPGSARRGI